MLNINKNVMSAKSRAVSNNPMKASSIHHLGKFKIFFFIFKQKFKAIQLLSKPLKDSLM